MSHNREIETLENLAHDEKWAGNLSAAYGARVKLERIYALEAGNDYTKTRIQNLNQLAGLAVKLKMLDEALLFAKTSVDLASEFPEEIKANSSMLYAAVLAENRRFAEAVVQAENAIAIFEGLRGADDDFVAYRKCDLRRMKDEDTRPYLSL